MTAGQAAVVAVLGIIAGCAGGRDAARSPGVGDSAAAAPPLVAVRDTGALDQDLHERCALCWMLPAGRSSSGGRDMVYQAAILGFAGAYKLHLDTLIGQAPGGRGALWRIVTTMSIGALPDAATIVASCGPRADSLDGRTFAVVRATGKEEYQVLRAWRIRVRDFAVDSLPAEAVHCVVEGYGV